MRREIYSKNNVYKPRLHISLAFEQLLWIQLWGYTTFYTPLSFNHKMNTGKETLIAHNHLKSEQLSY